MSKQKSEVCKGLVNILKGVHCESMLWYLLQDLHMYLYLPFLTQLCEGKFSDLRSNDESPLQSKQMIQKKNYYKFMLQRYLQ